MYEIISRTEGRREGCIEDQGSGTCEPGQVNEMRKLNLSTTQLLQIQFANAAAWQVAADTVQIQDSIKAKPEGTT